MTKRLLVTGFGTFGPHTANPTEDLVGSLAPDGVPGCQIRTAVLPVEYDEARTEVLRLIEDVRPDAVIMCGLYAGRPAITVEAIAVNVRDTPPHLATGSRSKSDPGPIEDGPDGLFATIPVRKIVRSIGAAGVPASVSYTAGTYVCNSTMYAVLNHARRTGSDMGAGFIHFPASTEMAVAQPSIPTLPSELMHRALLIALATTTENLESR